MELYGIILAFLIAAGLSLFMKRKAWIAGTSIAAATLAAVGATSVALRVATQGVDTTKFFFVDSLGAIILLIITYVGLAASVYSAAYLYHESRKKIIGLTRFRQYFGLFNLFIVTMLIAATADNPLLTWIAVEATTLATAFLISFYNKPTAMEAAWKYLIINTTGLLLALFGTLLFVASHGELMSWQALLNASSHLDPAVIKLAFVFVLIGYGTKIGLAPVHTWLPDAHSKAPAPISALMSGVLLNVALLVVLRFSAVTNSVIGPEFAHHLFIAFGLASIVFASLVMLNQKSYKRLLAYSSIENMGIIVLGIGFGGIGVFAALLHMIYHSLIKSSLFLTAGNFLLKYSSAKIELVKGALTIIPASSILFLVALFAVTGFPPFGMFLSELTTLVAGTGKFLPVVVIVMLALVVTFIGFLRQANAMILSEPPKDLGLKRGGQSVWLLIPPVALVTLALILSFYMPPFIQTLIQHTVAGY